ncbi:ATP-dependent zinc metalloprotease FtsH [Candidatus Similichlamydia epinepheli]|uniref:ATP-dependent zinc metalloprotease FtsH n=1 Tax=Candidatus Similichlamydia epinepheli TaxID=1903953 RepID=UPI000D38111A|nr:ATP-dependent zinc metalloprotease FtsH [Candidatus Similichlamydia epinepheli]
MKKRIPSGFFILIALALVGMSFLQGFFTLSYAQFSFPHQLEHLVNLELIHPEESRKVALNHGLVTLHGRCRDELPDRAEKKFQFLNLLNEHFQLSERKKRLFAKLKEARESSILAWNYFVSIRFANPQRGRIVLVPPSHEFPEVVSGIICDQKPFHQFLSFDQVVERFGAFISSPRLSDVPAARHLLQEFYEELQSPVLGIASESLKAHLRAASSLLEEAANYRGIQEHVHALRSVFDHLSIVTHGLEDPVGWNKEAKVRSIRDYYESLDSLIEISQKLIPLQVQLEVALQQEEGSIWFFEDAVLSSRELSEQDPDQFSLWFAQALQVWDQFPSNKGHSFKLPDQVRNRVLETTFRSQELSPNYLNYVMTFFPFLIMLIFLVISFSKQLKGMSGGAITFGRSPARLMQKGTSKITFQDVAGVEEAKAELQEIVSFLKNPQPFLAIGARIPKGILCVGPPGTGKTLIAKAVAGEADRPFFSMSGSDFVEMFVGVGASRVRDTFDQARRHAPCIVFMDEIDAVGRHRGVGIGGGNDEREQTLNQLLVEMDGFESNEGIILMAATNRPDVLDKALLRPGRFDRRVVIDLPDIRGRHEILQLHAKKIKISPNVDLMKIARSTPGASGADLENVLNEAALLAVHRSSDIVEDCDAREARDKVFFGKERKSFELDQEARWTTAVHEAGHAIVGKSLSHCDPVEKITIIPRGLALGATYTLPTKNRTGYKRDELGHILAMLFGGRCAEEILIGDISSGAQNDIERATEIARRMVCEWGMSDRFGPVTLDDKSDRSGASGLSYSVRSDETLREIDGEVLAILTEAKKTSEKILSEKKELLQNLSDLLIEFETLDSHELEEVILGTFDADKKRKSVETLTPIKVPTADGKSSEQDSSQPPQEENNPPDQEGKK